MSTTAATFSLLMIHLVHGALPMRIESASIMASVTETECHAMAENIVVQDVQALCAPDQVVASWVHAHKCELMPGGNTVESLLGEGIVNFACAKPVIE